MQPLRVALQSVCRVCAAPQSGSTAASLSKTAGVPAGLSSRVEKPPGDIPVLGTEPQVLKGGHAGWQKWPAPACPENDCPEERTGCCPQVSWTAQVMRLLAELEKTGPSAFSSLLPQLPVLWEQFCTNISAPKVVLWPRTLVFKFTLLAWFGSSSCGEDGAQVLARTQPGPAVS